MDAKSSQPEELVRVRRGRQVMQMDLPAVVSLIQQGALDSETEVNAIRLTGGEWKKLAGLDLYQTLQPSSSGDAGNDSRKPRGVGSDSRFDRQRSPVAGGPADLTEVYDQNLRDYFGSLAMRNLAMDSWMALVSAALAALFSAVAHRSILMLLANGMAWGGGLFLVEREQFSTWIRGVRFTGFRRFPWNSRLFHIVAVAVPGYFLVASFLPLLPREWLFVLLDTVVGIAFSGAAASVWAYRRNTLRLKRAFELSNGAGPVLVDSSAGP